MSMFDLPTELEAIDKGHGEGQVTDEEWSDRLGELQTIDQATDVADKGGWW